MKDGITPSPLYLQAKRCYNPNSHSIRWREVFSALGDIQDGKWVECDMCHAQRPPSLITWVDPVKHFGHRPRDGRLGLVALCKGGCKKIS